MIGMMIGSFTTPVTLEGWQRLLLLVPLCLAISIVYKTIRCERLADVPVASALLCVTIVCGMCGVGVGVWLLYLILA